MNTKKVNCNVHGKIIILVGLFFVSLLMGLSSVLASRYTEMIVFGDSLTDTGNIACDFAEYHSPPYYDCRFSDGPVWIEYLAEHLGLTIPLASRNGGTNYAVGGATTGAIRYGTPPHDMDIQIQNYLANNLPNANQLIVIWIGTNDFNAGQTDPSVSVDMIILHIKALATAGAKNFLVLNLSFHQYYRVQFVSPLFIDQFNTKLSEELSKLRIEVDSLSIYELDYSSLVDAIVLDPDTFGLENITEPACADCEYGLPASIPVDIVSNPEEYLFWDNIHLSTRAHQILANAAFHILPKYGGGMGTEEDPFQIWTAEHLITLGESPHDYDKHFIMMADIDLSGYTFDRAVIALDTDDTNHGFQGTAFRGVFDGGDHKILYLAIQGHSHLGLFGAVASSTAISNLGLEGVDVQGAGDYVGGFAGSNLGTVSGCYSTGTVTGNSSVGGLVGGNDGSITACYSIGTVTGLEYIGGLVGRNWGDITASYYAGSVTGDSSVGGLIGNNSYYGGGLAGIYVEGRITASYNNGSVTGNSSVGGLVGSNNSIITASYNSGSVSGHMLSEFKCIAKNKDYIGLLGFKRFNTIKDLTVSGEVCGRSSVGILAGYNNGTIDNCSVTGSVMGNNVVGGLCGKSSRGLSRNCHAAVTVTGEDYVGGLVGFNTGSITASYSTGTVTGRYSVGGLVGQNYQGEISSSHSTGTVTGGGSVGGLVGVNRGGWLGRLGYRSSFIFSSYSTGTVTGDWGVGGLVGDNAIGGYPVFPGYGGAGSIGSSYSTGAVTGNQSVGGLVGNNDSGCYVNRSHSTGMVVGNDCVGGFVGSNQGDVRSSYCTGVVSGTSNVGGLVGHHSRTGMVSGENKVGGEEFVWVTVVVDCYWDIETSGLTNMCGSQGEDCTGCDNSFGKTTSQMKQQSTFTDWDFINVWGIGEGQTYPYLRKYSAGDINKDGAVNLVDLSILAGQWMQGVEVEPGMVYKVGECDMGGAKTTAEGKRFSVTVDGRYIEFTDRIYANCCIEKGIEVDMAADGNVITITEMEMSEGQCRCMCDYPTTARLGPFEPARYVVEVVQADYSGQVVFTGEAEVVIGDGRFD